MSFFDKLKSGFASFMSGRHGADELSLALLIAGLILSLLSTLLRSPILSLLSLALYAYGLFRMLSRDHQKRYAENEKYKSIVHGSVPQFFVRLKNMRKYKYFKCPECNARLRLPRKVGEVTITCGKCRHSFKQKA